ncbi:MAG: glycosyltransferase family 9 protein [Opitutaceae bacterium]|nr:glycosyltransferase family 9 protein [Opitutaceae bacterium]
MAELWGLGDLALAMPFLREAARHGRVTLLAKPHAAPLLRRFAPAVELIEFTAPWTEFRGKYRFHHWPWREMRAVARQLRAEKLNAAVSARPDPREHLFLRWAGLRDLRGFPRAGSGFILRRALATPHEPHRAAYWRALADSFGWALPPPPATVPNGNHVVIHCGAAQPTRRWPRERYDIIATRLRNAGWRVTVLDEALTDLEVLLEHLAGADRFVGNDSGPGHLAALSGVPTYTLFGPQLPERFTPRHARAAWIEGAPCRFKPCHDYCRFDLPHCLLHHTTDAVWTDIQRWLQGL